MERIDLDELFRELELAEEKHAIEFEMSRDSDSAYRCEKVVDNRKQILGTICTKEYESRRNPPKKVRITVEAT